MSTFSSNFLLFYLNISAMTLAMAGYSYRNNADFNTIVAYLFATALITCSSYFLSLQIKSLVKIQIKLQNILLSLLCALVIFAGYGGGEPFMEILLLMLFVLLQMFIGLSIVRNTKQSMEAISVKTLHFFNFISLLVVFLDGINSELVWMSILGVFRVVQLELTKETLEDTLHINLFHIITILLILILRILA